MSHRSAKATQRAVRAAEEEVVNAQLKHFEHMYPAASLSAKQHGLSLPSNLSDSSASILGARASPSRSAQSPPLVSAKQIGTDIQGSRAYVDRLTVPPFGGTAVRGDRSLLAEAQQIQEAVMWLSECPSRTLQLLQQRVLCTTEALFKQLVGMPLTARKVLEHIAAESQSAVTDKAASTGDENDDDAVVPKYVLPPQPLTFSDFVGRFLRDCPADTSQTSGKLPFNFVLSSGRPQPVAPLTSLHLVYGLQVVEEVLRRPSFATSFPAPEALPAAATGLEDHQALLSEVIHWSAFFESIFDQAREGLCRDPLNLYAAVLLACAERGAWELRNTADALAEEAVRRLQLNDAASGRRPEVCLACRTEAALLANRCRSYVKHTLRTIAAPQPAADRTCSTTGRASTAKRGRIAPITRFFLATPAVAWWAASFLRLYRLRTPVAAPERASVVKEESSASTKTPDDVVSSAEAYFIRDWIAWAAKVDKAGLIVQENAGSLRIPLSCANNAPVAVIGFTQENVQAALDRMGMWVDSSVMANTPLRVDELLAALQNDYAVLPYYLSYFEDV
ncbi:hypothetical protein JKF63_06014 [Porcisia hertigi]|uniref:Uncharacterized protein n=1 Tax=Porcisia hertigi TaxID=2761500 RepID=A0A836LBV2_9TRYP|nr:hypothetical protein JKF63_06014 [Porcisia hertigi]